MFINIIYYYYFFIIIFIIFIIFIFIIIKSRGRGHHWYRHSLSLQIGGSGKKTISSVATKCYLGGGPHGNIHFSWALLD